MRLFDNFFILSMPLGDAIGRGVKDVLVDSRDFLTLEQAAEIAQVPSSRVLAWTQEGLPYLRIHDSIRIERENLFEWLAFDQAKR